MIVVLYIKMLHTKTPTQRLGGQFGNVGIPSASRSEPRSGKLGITDSSRETYSARMVAYKSAEAAELTYNLIASVRAREGVNLVDYHELKTVE